MPDHGEERPDRFTSLSGTSAKGQERQNPLSTKLAANYLAFVELASIRLSLRASESTPLGTYACNESYFPTKLEEMTMKIKTIALASAFALMSTLALAQSSTGGGAPAAPGAMNSETSGPTGRPSGDAATQKNMGTTGSSRPSAAGDASTSGAGTAAGPNSTGTATEPGAVKSGVNPR